jgi:hypothetical protein
MTPNLRMASIMFFGLVGTINSYNLLVFLLSARFSLVRTGSTVRCSSFYRTGRALGAFLNIPRFLLRSETIKRARRCLGGTAGALRRILKRVNYGTWRMGRGKYFRHELHAPACFDPVIKTPRSRPAKPRTVGYSGVAKLRSLQGSIQHLIMLLARPRLTIRVPAQQSTVCSLRWYRKNKAPVSQSMRLL